MTNKLKSTENKAKDVEVEAAKIKRIDIPKVAKMEIARMEVKLQDFIAGVVAGMGIKGKWSFDMQTKQLIVEKE